jgi:hypothetical protein
MTLPHRESPCANCPWRKDSEPGEFPPERYRALRSTAGRPGQEVDMRAPIFACHKSAEGKEMACAGWLAQVGYQHLGMRLAVVQGRLPVEALEPGEDWPELFEDYDELAERNGA